MDTATERSVGPADIAPAGPEVVSLGETDRRNATYASRQGAPSCPNCAQAAKPRTHVYALGRIHPRFPRISVEKEFAQAMGSSATAGLTDSGALHKVLTDPRLRYLVRQLCWVMTIAGLETYLVFPAYPSDWDHLIESVRPAPNLGALDAIIGTLGPVAPPELCNGLLLPIVVFDQLYSFDRDSLLKALPRPDKASKEFATVAAEVLDRILSVTDNAGATDEHRALNYLALRDPTIYARTADCYQRDLALTAVDVRPWRLSIARSVVEVVFTFTHRKNEFVEKYGARVDVNDEFPFLVSKLVPYLEHT
jgi:hypothetical protein